MPINVLLTDDQKQLIADEYADLEAQGLAAGNIQDCLAVKMGLQARTIRKYRNYNKATDAKPKLDPQEFVKGTSTLYDADGKVKLQWVKADRQQETERFKEWATALAEDLPQTAIIPAPTDCSDDLLTLLPMGDPHIGLYSWAAETGDDFNLEIATTDLCGAVDRLVRCTPASRECLIANLGDFLHADNASNETSRGHNKLDVDTRYTKVLLAGLKAMRQCIASALAHHEKVTVINAIGNHDDHSSMFLTIALSQIYENEPRLTIIDNPRLMHYYRFRNVMLAFHHGHTIKMDKIPLVAASEQPAMWGETKYRYSHTGHIHHDSKKEFNGMVVESHRTLAARDAWAASMGYMAGRDMKGIIYHGAYGEVARHLVSVDMLRKGPSFEFVKTTDIR